MDMFGAMKEAWALWKSRDATPPLWLMDEEAFHDHFGRTYVEFAGLLAELDQAHETSYEKTASVNPEAAITWVFFISADSYDGD
jgi:hypothetical protein